MSEILRDGDLRVRLMTETDVALVSRWLSDPRVLEYYEGRDNPQDERAVTEWLAEPDVTLCIVEWRGDPVGLIQLYEVRPEQKSLGGYHLDETIWGTDQFIGVPELWGAGLGSRLVSAVARLLLARGAARVVMDPQAWNARAIRAYEKAGFRKVRLLPKHELHEGEMRDCWLMEYLPPS